MFLAFEKKYPLLSFHFAVVKEQINSENLTSFTRNRAYAVFSGFFEPPHIRQSLKAKADIEN